MQCQICIASILIISKKLYNGIKAKYWQEQTRFVEYSDTSVMWDHCDKRPHFDERPLQQETGPKYICTFDKRSPAI